MCVPYEQPHVDSIEDQSVEDAICPGSLRHVDIDLMSGSAGGEGRRPENKLLELRPNIPEKSYEHKCDQPVSTNSTTEGSNSSVLEIGV